MKIMIRSLLLAVFAFSLTACLFKEPVFTEGFAKADAAFGGVWAVEPEKGQEGDVRKVEFAVCAPMDEGRLLVHYPVSDKNGIYYEARPLLLNGRTVLQLRALASFSDGIPKADADRFTLIWVEKIEGGKKLSVRALGGDKVKERTPAAIRKELETQSTDWGKMFGEAAVFQRLKDR